MIGVRYEPIVGMVLRNSLMVTVALKFNLDICFSLFRMSLHRGLETTELGKNIVYPFLNMMAHRIGITDVLCLYTI